MSIATLIHLSGPSRGTTWRLADETLFVVENRHGLLSYSGEAHAADGTVLLTLQRTGDGFRIAESPGVSAWINGERPDDRALASGDLIEVGESGLMLRYRQIPPHQRGYKTMRQAVGDCVDCARYGGKGPIDRAGVLVFGGGYELATQITPIARVSALGVAVVLVASVAALWQRNVHLQAELDRQIERVEGLTQLVQGSEREAFTRGDFADERSALDFRIDDALARVEALEARAGARGRVIAEASRSVIFLQGAYGFVEPRSGKPLRQLATIPPSNSQLTLAGDGAILELRYTGTGFVVGDEGLVITNRHVAVPWEFDENAQQLIQRGFTPQMRRFTGYLPGVEDGFAVSTVTTHAEADLAVLRCDASIAGIHGLELASNTPAIGDEVIVLGYPTGMRALLARADSAFVDRVMGAGPVGFWDLAAQLSTAGFIEPLATVGVIGQLSSGSIVYDAETTHGGSGGPVLTLTGDVVAVNAAILPEFGGSNLGVPTTLAAPLLERAAAAAR